MNGITARPATPKDAPYLVDIVLMAGEGLPEIGWAELAEPGEALRDVGLRRATRGEGSFSYTNATLFERDGRVVGGMVGFRLPDRPVEIDADFPAAFVPLQELENIVCGSWYVNILGVYEEFRGQGVGSLMLEHAAEIAGQTGAAGVSIIVFSANPGAERLYRRAGFKELARRTMSIPGWCHDRCEAILLVRS